MRRYSVKAGETSLTYIFHPRIPPSGRSMISLESRALVLSLWYHQKCYGWRSAKGSRVVCCEIIGKLTTFAVSDESPDILIRQTGSFTKFSAVKLNGILRNKGSGTPNSSTLGTFWQSKSFCTNGIM